VNRENLKQFIVVPLRTTGLRGEAHIDGIAYVGDLRGDMRARLPKTAPRQRRHAALAAQCRRKFPGTTKACRIYPVKDGFYAAGPGKADMLNFLRAVLGALGHEFNVTEENRLQRWTTAGTMLSVASMSTTISPFPRSSRVANQ
jgi:hypothetical protein